MRLLSLIVTVSPISGSAVYIRQFFQKITFHSVDQTSPELFNNALTVLTAVKAHESVLSSTKQHCEVASTLVSDINARILGLSVHFPAYADPGRALSDFFIAEGHLTDALVGCLVPALLGPFSDAIDTLAASHPNLVSKVLADALVQALASELATTRKLLDLDALLTSHQQLLTLIHSLAQTWDTQQGWTQDRIFDLVSLAGIGKLVMEKTELAGEFGLLRSRFEAVEGQLYALMSRMGIEDPRNRWRKPVV